jgi:hypothetical protein
VAIPCCRTQRINYTGVAIPCCRTQRINRCVFISYFTGVYSYHISQVCIHIIFHRYVFIS